MKGVSAARSYKTIFENALDGILISDSETGKILECNSAFARLSGWKKSELIGKTRTTVFPDETNKGKRTKNPKSANQRTTAKTVQTILLTKKGESKAVKRKSKPTNFDGKKHNVEYVHAILGPPGEPDQSSKILLTILDSIDADVYAADLQTFEILFANKHMRDSFGENLEGRICHKIFRGESAPCSHCKNDLLVDKRGKPTGVQVWDGYNPVSKKWYSNADRAIRWHDGRLVRLQIALDITEKELAVQGLRESEERYRDLVDNIHDLICTHDMDGVLLSVNPAATAMTGYSLDEMIGHNLREFIDPERQADFDTYLDVIKSDGVAEGLMRIKTKSGDIRIWSYQNTLRKEAPGDPFVRGYASDVTEKKRSEDAIKASENLLKLSQQIANLGSWELDLTDHSLTWSEEVYRIFGVQPKEFKPTYKAFLECIHPGDRETVDKVYTNSIKDDRDSYEIEHRIIRKDDGEILIVYEKCQPIRGQEGKIVGSAGVIHDITERKRNENELFQSRQMLQLILDNVPQRIFWKDHESRYLGCNKPFADDAGLRAPEDIIGMDDYQLSWKENADLYRSDDKKVMDEGIAKIYYEEPQDRNSGEKLWLITSKVPLRNQDNDIFGVMGVYEDITEQKIMREALRLEKERAQHYLDIAGVMILALDREGKVAQINKKGIEILGYQEEEILGHDWNEKFLPEEERPALKQVLADLVDNQGDDFRHYSNYVLTKDGEKRYINWYNSLLKDENGVVIGTLSSGGDITERKQMEDNLRRRADELAALQETLLGITSRHSLPELLQSIVERAVNLLEGSSGGLYLTDPEERQVNLAVSYKTKRDYVGTSLAYGEGAAGHIADTGQPLILDDYRTWPGRSPVYEEDQPFQAILATPLLWEGSVTGILHVHRDDKKNKFSQHDLVLLGMFANHAAVAVENARLYSSLTQELVDRKSAENEARRQMAELETLYETGTTISRLLEPDAIGEEIIASLSEHLAWHHVAIRLRREESDELEFIAFNKPELLEKEKGKVVERVNDLISKEGQGVSGWVVQTGEVVRTGNVHDNPHYVEADPGIQSGLYVPLKIGERVLGCLMIESEQPDAFTEQDERLLVTLSAHAAVAFENARLYQEIQQELIERKRTDEKLLAQTRELEALFSISTHLRSAQTVDEMLPIVLAEMQRVLGTDSNAVLLLDKERTEFTYASGNGVFQAYVGITINVEDGISGHIFMSGQPYISDALATDARRDKHLPDAEQLGPAVFVPLNSETDFLGILVGARDRKTVPMKFSERDMRLLSAVGEMVGNAIRRMRLFDEALNRMRQVQALHSVDMAIASSIDAKTTLDMILSQILAHMSADATAVLLFKSDTQILEYASVLGFRYQEVKKQQFWPGEGLAGQVVQSGKIVSILNLEAIENTQTQALALEKMSSYHAVPMIVKGQVRGVLEIYYRQSKAIDEDQIEFLETLAAQAAIAVDNAELFSNLQRSNLDLIMAYDATIEGWSQALDLRDHDAEEHTQRVTKLTLTLAREFGLIDELNHIRWGALLHDIGNIGVPDKILFKPAALTEAEWAIMREHPEYAYRLISPIDFLRPSLDIPYCHHEKWDGSGYPRGLKGEEIPIAARIFAVVDVFEALTSDRPYRKAWTREDAIEYLQAQKGIHFDPDVLDIFLRQIRMGDEG